MESAPGDFRAQEHTIKMWRRRGGETSFTTPAKRVHGPIGLGERKLDSPAATKKEKGVKKKLCQGGMKAAKQTNSGGVIEGERGDDRRRSPEHPPARKKRGELIWKKK